MNNHIINIKKIAFIEFAVESESQINDFLTRFDFKKVKESLDGFSVYRQNHIYLIVNFDRTVRTRSFYEKHGPSILSVGLRVDKVANALIHAKTLGLKVLDCSSNPYHLLGIDWVGGSQLFFIDEETCQRQGYECFDQELDSSSGLVDIDHVAINVYPGQSAQWVALYKNLFSMTELKQFQIQGQYTKFTSQALINADKTFRVVINESDDEHSQISEYLNQYHGEGVQHLAFSTQDIYHSVAFLKNKAMKFMDIPDTYYELIDVRLPHHGEDIAKLQAARVLIDGDMYQESNILLQIFTHTLVGPIFFELIQRKGNEGFGGGNIKALYESVERDQLKRGVLKNKVGEAA